MSDPVARSSLTAQLVNYLVAVLEPAILVGRGTAPQAGGWPSGQPGQGTFVPYVTVKAQSATPRLQDTLGRSRIGWSCAYRLSYSGAKESSTDDVADFGRAAIVGFPGIDENPLMVTLGGVAWRLDKIDVPRLGAPGSNSSTDPPFWDVTDDVAFWLSRSLSG